MAKLVKYIFIPFFFVFLMSHNASAVTTVLDMHDYDVINQEGQLRINCEFYGSPSVISNATECTSGPSGSGDQFNNAFLRYIRSTTQWNVKEGDILEFDVNVFSPFSISSGQVNMSEPVGVNLYFLGGSADFTSMEYKQTVSNVYEVETSILPSAIYQSVYHVTYRARRDGAVYIGLTSSQHWFQWMGKSSAKLTFAIYNVMHYRYAGSEENKEQAEATQNSADNSETSGSSSQNDATNATSSLISVITSGIGAITSASASNCVINADMGNFDMGSIDLCANPVPTFMQVIGSIIAALVVLPLVIVLFNRFISIIGSFQR